MKVSLIVKDSNQICAFGKASKLNVKKRSKTKAPLCFFQIPSLELQAFRSPYISHCDTTCRENLVYS